MALSGTRLLKRRAIGTETVRDDSLRLEAVILQKPPRQSQRCALSASVLHDHVHDLALVIDLGPDPHALACNRRDKFTKMPALRQQ
jgi:hypothetical protein